MRVAGQGVWLHLRDQSGAVRCVCPCPALRWGASTAPLSGAKSGAQPRGPLASPGLWHHLAPSSGGYGISCVRKRVSEGSWSSRAMLCREGCGVTQTPSSRVLAGPPKSLCRSPKPSVMAFAVRPLEGELDEGMERDPHEGPVAPREEAELSPQPTCGGEAV